MNAVVGGGPVETFRGAQRLGFAGVEVDLTRDELGAAERLDELQRASRASGVGVPSLVLGEHSDRGGIADREPQVAQAAREDVERAVDWAVALDADAILVPFFGRAELVDDADIGRAAGAFRPLCDDAGSRGVTLPV